MDTLPCATDGIYKFVCPIRNNACRQRDVRLSDSKKYAGLKIIRFKKGPECGFSLYFF